jgi:hypothetical protein
MNNLTSNFYLESATGKKKASFVCVARGPEFLPPPRYSVEEPATRAEGRTVFILANKVHRPALYRFFFWNRGFVIHCSSVPFNPVPNIL